MIFWAYVLVFLLGATPFLEVVGIIPIGVAAGLSAWKVTIIAVLGNLTTIWLLILLVDKFHQWREKRKRHENKPPTSTRHKRAAHIWNKYGLPGLAILSPFFIGSHLGALLAMGFGGTKKRTGIWMTASVLAWSILMGVLSYYGFDLFFTQTEREGFLTDFLQERP